MLFGVGGEKQVVSLDWDAYALRLVQWQLTKNRAKVLKARTFPLDRNVDVHDAPSLGRFVGEVFAREKIRATLVIVDIPRDQTVLNTISLPAVDVSTLAGMVQLQIAKELPFPLADAIVDFAVYQQARDESVTDVLVAAIRREVLEFYKSVAETAGLKLMRVGLRPFANMVAVNEMLGGGQTGRVLFIDVGPRLTEVSVIRDGMLAFSRAASVRLEDDEPSESPDVSDVVLDSRDKQKEIERRLLVEITRSAEAYRSTDPAMRFDHIIIAGSTGLEPGLVTQVSQRFSIQAKIFDPSHILGKTKNVSGPLCGFSAAVGLGSGHASAGRLHFDFLHPKKPMNAATVRNRRLRAVGAAAAVVLLAGAFSYAMGIAPKKAQIAEMEKKIAEIKDRIEIYERAEIVVKLAEKWRADQWVWPDELMLILQAMPEDPQSAYLEDLDLRDGKVTLKVRARDHQVIPDLRNQLDTMSHLGKDGNPIEGTSAFKASYRIMSKQSEDLQYPYETTMTLLAERKSDSGR